MTTIYSRHGCKSANSGKTFTSMVAVLFNLPGVGIFPSSSIPLSLRCIADLGTIAPLCCQRLLVAAEIVLVALLAACERNATAFAEHSAIVRRTAGMRSHCRLSERSPLASPFEDPSRKASGKASPNPFEHPTS